jgi:hypothetical protein
MGSGKYVDHDKELRKMNATAQAQEMQDKEVRGESIVKHTCYNCKRKRNCPKFSSMTNRDVVSVGGDGTTFTCGNWKETADNYSDPKKTKALLKQFRKMLK